MMPPIGWRIRRCCGWLSANGGASSYTRCYASRCVHSRAADLVKLQERHAAALERLFKVEP